MTYEEVKRKIIIRSIVAVLLAIIIFTSSYQLSGILMEYWQPGYREISTAKFSAEEAYGLKGFSRGFNVPAPKGVIESSLGKFNAPQYSLPLNLDEIVNLGNVREKLGLTDSDLDGIRLNGFVAKSYGRFDSFIDAYRFIKSNNLPIFITADSILHIYYNFYVNLLMDLESKYFINWIREMSKSMVYRADLMYNSIPIEYELIKKSSMKVVCYLSIIAKLMNRDFEIPDYAIDIVETELNYINKADGIHISPIFGYKVGYTCFKPKGHYLVNEDLMNYYRALTWLSIMIFPIEDDSSLIQSIILIIILENSKVNIDGEEFRVKDLWEKMYLTYSFFIGNNFGLTIYDYINAIRNVFGEQFSIFDLNDKSKIMLLKEELENIFRRKVAEFPFEIKETNMIGLKLLCHNFNLDSYIFDMLSHDNVKFRYLPSGLDLPLILCSDRAERHLSNEFNKYANYGEQVRKLKSQIERLNYDFWIGNLYSYWLYILKSLIRKFDSGYPSFMQTDAWLDEKLNTFLGSWTEIKCTLIPIFKPTISSESLFKVKFKASLGYVEPIPEFYGRLIDLCNLTLIGLRNLDLINSEYENGILKLINLLNKLRRIAIKELLGIELSNIDYKFIFNIDLNFESIINSIKGGSLKTTCIGNAYTSTDINKILIIGCGYIDFIIVIIRTVDGKLIATTGPIFSYYEFTRNISEKLTESEWREVLKLMEIERPFWVKSFYG